MNNGLKWGLILGGSAFIGVGLFYIIKHRKSGKSESGKTDTKPPADLTNVTMSAKAQNGNIVIEAGSNTYTYELQGYKFKWWTIQVNNIDLDNKKVTYTNPQSGQQATEDLEEWVITDIKNGLGNNDISMGETSDGIKIRLQKA